jgi:hypothetical protein
VSGLSLSSIQMAGSHVDLSDRIFTSTTVVASPSGATQTSIATVTVTSPVLTRLGVIVLADAALTVGTNGVSVQLRLYHGTSSGTKIGDTGALTAVATDLYCPHVFGIDTSPVLPGQVYTMTLTVASGSATSTVSAVNMIALAI